MEPAAAVPEGDPVVQCGDATAVNGSISSTGNSDCRTSVFLPDFSQAGGDRQQTAARPSDVITINVGGRKFTTTRSTLCMVPDSVLAAVLLRWESVDEEGCLFLDRDPDVFAAVLSCLRNPALQARDAAKAASVSMPMLSAEVHYLGLASIISCDDTVERVLADNIRAAQDVVSSACASGVKDLVDEAFAAVAAPLLANVSRPGPGRQSAAYYPAEPQLMDADFTPDLVGGNGNTAKENYDARPPMLDGECIVGAVTSKDCSADHYKQYRCAVVTNFCRVSKCYASYNGNGGMTTCHGWSAWKGDPYPMTEEYVRLAGAMPPVWGDHTNIYEGEADEYGQTTRKTGAEVFFDRMVAIYKAHHRPDGGQ